MTKRRISATIDPDTLDRAVELTGETNVSSLLEQALRELIETRLEARWLAAQDGAADDLPQNVEHDLSHLPWDS